MRFQVWAIAAKGQIQGLHELAVSGSPEEPGRMRLSNVGGHPVGRGGGPGWSGVLRLQSRRPTGTLTRPVATGMAVVCSTDARTRPGGRRQSSELRGMALDSGTVWVASRNLEVPDRTVFRSLSFLDNASHSGYFCTQSRGVASMPRTEARSR